MGDGDMVLKRAHTDFGDYEEDVIAEILARLPVKSLMRFRCVCKSWRALISESYFVKKHLNYGERGITESTPRFIFMLDPPLSLDFEALMKDDDCDGAAGGQSAVTQLDFPVLKTIRLESCYWFLQWLCMSRSSPRGHYVMEPWYKRLQGFTKTSLCYELRV
ncbi:putative F-box protein At3g51171 [Rosa rugosa]|uniref:putative F-box protein At3g51171 n=1 Tax=Rosa rugosa TaxID=74645 RepID=UPI002B412C6A|nr:putative F-box protein At3g51171 [Rosa rugosa]